MTMVRWRRFNHPRLWRCWTYLPFVALVCLIGGLFLHIFVLGPSPMIHRSVKSRESCGGERRHVILLRVPKTGSSTTTFMIWRYALRKKLTVLLPKPDQEETYPGIKSTWHDVSVPRYDIMANQIIYNPLNFAEYFPGDTVVIALVRHPLQHLISSIHYIPNDYIRAVISGQDKVAKYLKNPLKYENMVGKSLVSLTDNPLATIFGLNKHHSRNGSLISNFISRIDRQFGVVLILEQLDESLVMLKRTLCWSIKDIIYRVENVNTAKPEVHVSPEDSLRHRAWAMADYAIYEHFFEKLRRYVGQNGADFMEEVAGFKILLQTIWNFCDNLKTDEDILHLQGTGFYTHFYYSAYECKFLNFTSRHLRNLIRQQQNLPLE